MKPNSTPSCIEVSDPTYAEVCAKAPPGRYCQFCAGTSGLERWKEEFYLQHLADKLGITLTGVTRRGSVQTKSTGPNPNQTGVRTSGVIRRQDIPDHGPGTELETLIVEKELAPKGKGCFSCKNFVITMNYWGIEGCKKNRKQIVAKLQQSANKAGWLAKLHGAKVALELKINPLNLLDWLVDEAIRRAESKVNNASQ